MRRLLTLLTICGLSLVNAQIFSENFNSGFPGSMSSVTINGNVPWAACGGDTGGVSCPIEGTGSATFYHNSSTAYNSALVTPVLNLSGGVYKVDFTLAKRKKNDKVNEFFVELSNDGGATWAAVYANLVEVYEPTNYSFVLSPYGPNENTQIRFRARNKGGYRLILDNIVVSEVTSDDISLYELFVQPLVIAGTNEIKGSLMNNGLNTLTSFDVNWQVNGGPVNTHSFTGQNIAPGEIFNFTHEDIWEAVGGNAELKVWVSNTNVTDTNPANDEIISNIMVASGSAYKLPLMEKFSSSTCPPCYSYNTNSFNPFFNSYGHSKAAFISYQVNWPGAGDPYYTAEVGQRVQYYGIIGAPTLLMNAKDVGLPSITGLQTLLDQIIASDNISFFKIEADHTINGNNIEVTVDVTPYISGNYTLRVMVIEKLTTGNIATNGETQFHHVFMKALPNMAGTNVSFVQDQVEHFTFTQDMSSTHVEEMDDLMVVVFLQDNATKQILQSAYTEASGMEMGVSELEANFVALVPNPTTGLVTILSDKVVDVQVFDLTGKNVFNQAKVSNNSTLNLSHLGKGVYVVSMTDKDGVKVVKKLVIK